MLGKNKGYPSENEPAERKIIAFLVTYKGNPSKNEPAERKILAVWVKYKDDPSEMRLRAAEFLYSGPQVNFCGLRKFLRPHKNRLNPTQQTPPSNSTQGGGG